MALTDMYTQQSPNTSLRQNILDAWGKYGDWNAGGVDRASELANMFAERGITDLSQLGMAEKNVPIETGRLVRMASDPFSYLADKNALTQDQINSMLYSDTPTDSLGLPKTVDMRGNVLTYGGQDFGYFNPSKDTINPGLMSNTDKGNNEFAWSSQGNGNVGYTMNRAEDGTYYVTPTWGSSSDMGEIRNALKAAAVIAGTGYGLSMLGGMGAGAGAGETVLGLGADQVGALAGAAEGAAPAIGNGAWLGEGIASGVPTWDAAAGLSGIAGGGTAAGLSSADKAAMYGAEGYGPGMSGTATSAYDSVLNLTGSKELANVAGQAGSLYGKLSALSPTGGTGNIINALGSIYNSYQQNKTYQNQIDNLQQLFGPDSAYAKTLRKELDRKDAAGGRRSQYGPREVELQARLAQLAAGQAGTLSSLYDKSNANRNLLVQSLLRNSAVTGGLNNMFTSLGDLFGG